MQSLEEYNKGSLLGVRAGFTTGLAVSALAKAGIYYLFNKKIETVRAFTKEQVYIDLILEDISYEKLEISKNIFVDSVKLFATKDSGDDPDITKGIKLGIRIAFIDKDIDKLEFIQEKIEEALLDKNIVDDNNFKIYIYAGKGVGKLTKSGLDRSIGEAAINTVPRQMIRDNIREALEEFNINLKKFSKNILVEVFAINGEEIAKKTFNEKLGIVGGISILGTTGLLKAMSKDALIETIKIDVRTKIENSAYLIAAPGNYGIDFISKYNIDKIRVIEFSNYIGKFLDLAVSFNAEGILIVGHIGKLIKVAAGIMNTHSNEADARNEIILTHFIKTSSNLNADIVLDRANKIISSITTDESISYIKDLGILDLVMQSIGESIYFHINKRLQRAFDLKNRDNNYKFDIKLGIISFNKSEGELFRVGEVEYILERV